MTYIYFFTASNAQRSWKKLCCWRGNMSKKCFKWNKICSYKILDKLKLIKALCGQRITFCYKNYGIKLPIVALALYGRMWPYVAFYGLMWAYVALYGHIWPCMAVCGLLWSCMCRLVVLYGLFMGLYGIFMVLNSKISILFDLYRLEIWGLVG